MQALLKSLGLEQLDLLICGHFHHLICEEGIAVSSASVDPRYR